MLMHRPLLRVLPNLKKWLLDGYWMPALLRGFISQVTCAVAEPACVLILLMQMSLLVQLLKNH